MPRAKKKISTEQKILRYLSKEYDGIVIMGLIIASAAISGFFFGTQTLNPTQIPIMEQKTTLALKAKAPDPNKSIISEREARIFDQMMDEVIGACYYDTYIQNDTPVMSGDICNKAMSLNKQICKDFPQLKLPSCKDDYLIKYLKGMEG